MKLDVFQVPAGQKRAGWWTFTVDGAPSLWYSTSEAAIWRKIRRLADPEAQNKATIRLQALKGTGTPQGGQGNAKAELVKPLTLAEFMRRGKLGLAASAGPTPAERAKVVVEQG